MQAQTATLGEINSRLASLERERRSRRQLVLPPLKRLPRRHLDGLPGWDFEVPAEHVKDGVDPAVTCRCGSETMLSMKLPMACAGGCGRFFLRTRNGVRVKLFNLEDETA